MNCKSLLCCAAATFAALILAGCSSLKKSSSEGSLTLPSKICPLTLDGLFYETRSGRTSIPAAMFVSAQNGGEAQARMPEGRVVTISVKPDGDDFTVKLSAAPDKDIVKWGLAVAATPDEYFTGIMERVVDGPQQASWATNITAAMNLRGQKVDMILKPTTSVYAPFYLSSRGYAAFAKTDWPGFYDFCSSDSRRVKIEFEGPSFEIKFFTATHPAELVKAHALEAGPPFMPPKWMFTPWRWRDEHKQRTEYYDGTPVTGPFNSEIMEDVLMMKAFGIPCGVYWVDRPWGPGKNGCDDFEIDEQRLPHFADTIKWLGEQDTKMVMWIAPFFQGEMETSALARGWTLASAGQKPTRNNYPMVDFTNPEAKKYWQDGVAKFLKMGVAGFKLDRAEEQIPEKGDYFVFDERS
ncbi:MAG TPA: glycoside hydrolase family 31 protein, partial [Verrucomicrobiota bacterium]|nr:glycoside hydrolase family 31 protein [Verrucomicrobiota bacterium]